MLFPPCIPIFPAAFVDRITFLLGRAFDLSRNPVFRSRGDFLGTLCSRASMDLPPFVRGRAASTAATVWSQCPESDVRLPTVSVPRFAVALACPGLLYFHSNFKIDSTVSSKKKKCETASWDFGWSTQNPQIARGVKQHLNNTEPRPPSGRSAPVQPLGPGPVTAGLGGPTD